MDSFRLPLLSLPIPSKEDSPLAPFLPDLDLMSAAPVPSFFANSDVFELPLSPLDYESSLLGLNPSTLPLKFPPIPSRNIPPLGNLFVGCDIHVSPFSGLKSSSFESEVPVPVPNPIPDFSGNRPDTSPTDWVVVKKAPWLNLNFDFRLVGRREKLSPMGYQFQQEYYQSIRYDLHQEIELSSKLTEEEEGVDIDPDIDPAFDLFCQVRLVFADSLTEVKNDQGVIVQCLQNSRVMQVVRDPSTLSSGNLKLALRFIDSSYHHRGREFRLEVRYVSHSNDCVALLRSPPFKIYARKKQKKFKKKKMPSLTGSKRRRIPSRSKVKSKSKSKSRSGQPIRKRRRKTSELLNCERLEEFGGKLDELCSLLDQFPPGERKKCLELFVPAMAALREERVLL